METLDSQVQSLYGGRVRIRVCGICIQENKLLMVNHKLYGSESDFWSPPGGGINFGESASDALKREFVEETGLEVIVGKMLFVNEFIQPPLHAIEIFFEVVDFNGELVAGGDPEFSEHNQILKEVRFLSFDEIEAIPKGSKHGILCDIQSIQDIFTIKGINTSK